MVHERYMDVDPSIASYFDDLNTVSELWRTLKPHPQETGEFKEKRKQIAAYVIAEAGEYEPLFYSFIAGSLVGSDEQTVIRIAKSIGMVIHEKQMKKTGAKERLIEKILFRAEKPVVRERLRETARLLGSSLLKRTLAGHNVRSFLENLETGADLPIDRYLQQQEHNVNRSLAMAIMKVSMYEACLLTSNLDDANELIRSFGDLEFGYLEIELIQGYYFVRGAKEHRDISKAGISFLEVRKQAEQYREQYEQEKIQSASLSKQLQMVSRSAEEQLEDALEDLESLQNELQDAHITIHDLNLVLDTYKRRIAELEQRNLTGLLVLVIGHQAQKTMYEQEIAKRGGICEFFLADAKGSNSIMKRLGSATDRADLIFYITTHTNHMIHDYLRENVTPRDKYIFLPAKGRDSFTRKLDEAMEKKQTATLVQ